MKIHQIVNNTDMRPLFLHNRRARTRGFTLVELMVSLSVFSIVMLISTGVLLVMIDVNAKGQALYSSYSNLAFALDSMTREIRTGRNYYCDDAQESFPSPGDTLNCASGEMIVFNRGWSEEQIGYRFEGGRIEQKITSSGTWQPITADEVLIRQFSIAVENTSDSDEKQPTVGVVVDGEIYNGLNAPTSFNIATQVVQRILDR
jgi:prepilin-type N-terminal cleavage/methylation domain-containing protein